VRNSKDSDERARGETPKCGDGARIALGDKHMVVELLVEWMWLQDCPVLSHLVLVQCRDLEAYIGESYFPIPKS
jgi:hypothetical protein